MYQIININSNANFHSQKQLTIYKPCSTAEHIAAVVSYIHNLHMHHTLGSPQGGVLFCFQFCCNSVKVDEKIQEPILRIYVRLQRQRFSRLERFSE
jgi:hypothetical protein